MKSKGVPAARQTLQRLRQKCTDCGILELPGRPFGRSFYFALQAKAISLQCADYGMGSWLCLTITERAVCISHIRYLTPSQGQGSFPSR